MRCIVRAAAAVTVVGLLLVATPVVLATVTGGCTVTGESPAGSIDLTTATEWHLRSSDVVGGSGTAPSPQKAATVYAYSLGLALPVVSGQSEDEDGDTEGSASGIAVATYTALGHRFVVAGTSTGDGGGCSGNVIIVLDDVNPFLTVLGGGGLVLAVLGLLGVLWAARRESGCAIVALGLFFGGLAGLGLAVLLEQLGIVDPTTFVGFAILIVSAIIGAVLVGRLGSRPTEVA